MSDNTEYKPLPSPKDSRVVGQRGCGEGAESAEQGKSMRVLRPFPTPSNFLGQAVRPPWFRVAVRYASEEDAASLRC